MGVLRKEQGEGLPGDCEVLFVVCLFVCLFVEHADLKKKSNYRMPPTAVRHCQ